MPNAYIAGIGLDVASQELETQHIGEATRTASGRLRVDTVAIRRRWQIDCNYMTNDLYSDLMEQLVAVSFGMTKFWIDDMGTTYDGNGIDARVTIASDKRVQFRKSDNTWEHRGRNLTLVIDEQ